MLDCVLGTVGWSTLPGVRLVWGQQLKLGGGVRILICGLLRIEDSFIKRG